MVGGGREGKEGRREHLGQSCDMSTSGGLLASCFSRNTSTFLEEIRLKKKKILK